MESEYSPVVREAQRIVATQADCSLDEAIALMENTAEVTSASLEFIAAEVVAGRVSFDTSET